MTKRLSLRFKFDLKLCETCIYWQKLEESLSNLDFLDYTKIKRKWSYSTTQQRMNGCGGRVVCATCVQLDIVGVCVLVDYKWKSFTILFLVLDVQWKWVYNMAENSNDSNQMSF